MPYPFIGVIVQVDKVCFPLTAERLAVHCKAMVLARYKSPVRANLQYRLVVTPVPVFQLIGLCAACD